jgi:hypothetical protein
MIWFMAVDAKSPINLLQKDHAHHLMWKCHIRKGKLVIRPGANLPGQPQASSNDKDQIILSLHGQICQFAGQQFVVILALGIPGNVRDLFGYSTYNNNAGIYRFDVKDNGKITTRIGGGNLTGSVFFNTAYTI